jgi:hypothetical protein
VINTIRLIIIIIILFISLIGVYKYYNMFLVINLIFNINQIWFVYFFCLIVVGSILLGYLVGEILINIIKDFFKKSKRSF